jgi:predicted ArsR family transcriptional regulator
MSTVDRLMHLLKTRGPQPAHVLAGWLGLTSMGARKHLLALEERGMVRSEDRQQGVGRPARYWDLTHAGQARFPDRHADLTVQLIRQVRHVFGEEGLERLVAQRESETRSAYDAELARTRGAAERVLALTELRNRDGYMAELTPREEGGWLLSENHCPICSAAGACPDFCASELNVFRHLLGPEVEVEREDHALAGSRRCSYRIVPATGER